MFENELDQQLLTMLDEDLDTNNYIISLTRSSFSESSEYSL